MILLKLAAVPGEGPHVFDASAHAGGPGSAAARRVAGRAPGWPVRAKEAQAARTPRFRPAQLAPAVRTAALGLSRVMRGSGTVRRLTP